MTDLKNTSLYHLIEFFVPFLFHFVSFSFRYYPYLILKSPSLNSVLIYVYTFLVLSCSRQLNCFQYHPAVSVLLVHIEYFTFEQYILCHESSFVGVSIKVTKFE